MSNEKIYDRLNKHGGLKLPSYMAVIPRDKNFFLLDSDRIEKAFKSNKEFNLKSFEMARPKEDRMPSVANFNFEAIIEYYNSEFALNISVHSTEGLDLPNFSFANTIDKESLNIAIKQPYYLEVETLFNEDATTSFLFQLKVLYTLVPNASLVIDFSSLRLLSPYWLKMTADSSIPPSPNYLYTIHAVYDELENGEKQYWLHTHGLHRCGSMELEMLNFKSGINEMHNLLNTAAKLFIIDHYKENESFQVGYDGLGIFLTWVRWEEALKDFPANILGGVKDRINEDESYNIHSEPSGILYAVEDNNYTSPEIFTKTLADNPIYLIRTEETQRMSALAKERFHMFRDTYSKHNTTTSFKSGFLGKLFGKIRKEEENDWRFLVKLGLLVDNARDENDREHLWFEVLSIDEDSVTGKLLNQPYWITKLNEGDIHAYPVSQTLTDWVIYGHEGDYTPDSIYTLYY